MAQPRRGHDSYGRPLPTLVPPSEPAPHVALPQNRAMRDYVLALLDATYADVLHPGVRAQIAVHLTVVDGRLQPIVDCTVTQQYRVEQEGR